MTMKKEVLYQLRSRKIVKQRLPSTPKPHRSVKTKVKVAAAPKPKVSKKIKLFVPPFLSQAGQENFIKCFLGGRENMEIALLKSQMLWISWASKAVEYYNVKKGCGFKLKKVKAVRVSSLPSNMTIHMNFTAQAAEGAGTCSFFFAELYVWRGIDPGKMLEVKGCCILEQVDSGNEDYDSCGHCCANGLADSPPVIHPGPAYGYRSAEGDDDFVNYHFSWQNARIWRHWKVAHLAN